MFPVESTVKTTQRLPMPSMHSTHTNGVTICVKDHQPDKRAYATAQTQHPPNQQRLGNVTTPSMHCSTQHEQRENAFTNFNVNTQTHRPRFNCV